MGPILLLLVCAVFIGIENTIIARKFDDISPLASQPVYALCYFLVCAFVWPFRDHLGLTVKNTPLSILSWVIAAGLIFAIFVIILGFLWPTPPTAVPPAETMSSWKRFLWIIIAGLIFAGGAILYFEAYVRGATPQLAVTVLGVGIPISMAVINMAIDRQMPTINTIGSIVLVTLAVVLLRRDLPSGPPPEAPPPMEAAPAVTQAQ